MTVIPATIEVIKLIGLDLGRTTSNENNQSSIDGGNLWQKFEKDGYAERISNKKGKDIYAVYYGYQGNHADPFRYFIGCRVTDNDKAPEGMNSLTIPAGEYQKITAKGKMPDCMVNTWKKIWESEIKREYHLDFEVYGERSRNWDDAVIDIYLS